MLCNAVLILYLLMILKIIVRNRFKELKEGWLLLNDYAFLFFYNDVHSFIPVDLKDIENILEFLYCLSFFRTGTALQKPMLLHIHIMILRLKDSFQSN